MKYACLIIMATCTVAESGLRAMWYGNALLAHQPCVGAVSELSLNYTAADSLPPRCQAQKPSLDLFTVRMDGVLTAPDAGSYQFRVVTNGAVRLWLDDHILVDTSCDTPLGSQRQQTAAPATGRLGSLAGNCAQWDVPPEHATVTFNGRDNVTHRIERGLHMRLEWLHYGGHNAHLAVLWRSGAPSSAAPLVTNGSPFTFIPPSALSTQIPEPEQWRQDLQAKLAQGWNTWMRDSAARHVHLPSGFGFEVSIFDSATNQSFGEGLIDKCDGADANSCKVIAGHHTFNGSATSYVQRTEWDSATGVPTTNVTISSAHVGAAGDEMVLVVGPSRLNTSLWAIITPGFFFDCAIQHNGVPVLGQWIGACGNITTANLPGKNSVLVSAHPTGQKSSFLTILCSAAAGGCRRELTGLNMTGDSIAVPLSDGPISVSGVGSLHAADQTPQWRQAAAAQAITTERLQEVTDKLDEDYPRAKVGRMRDSAEAMRTVIGWNTVWDQRVGVMTPVSRTFGVNPFIMWDWDTYFLSLMAAESDKLLGYSNVLTVTRGRAIRGQVPNAQCAQWTDDDRTEPYVGAMVVREHFRKYGEIQLVELLYDDLLAWNNWALEKRTLGPVGLISVGSDVVTTAPYDGHTKQAAIWETGMDNSPMYDQVTWSAAQNKMLIYDIGMTSEWLGEVEALQDLAAALNKTDDVLMLQARQANMSAKVQSTLWSEASQIYLNYQQDTQTFNTHTSPTSFYPMLSGTATLDQALAMTRRWLTNHSGYCIGNFSTYSYRPGNSSCSVGALGGGDMKRSNLTVADALAWCKQSAKCAGFTTQNASCAATGSTVFDVRFKDEWGAKHPNNDPLSTSWLIVDNSLSPCRFALPSTPNEDPAYKNNNYWRGRVWGPLNLLVYMGLRHPKYASHPEIAAARKQLTIQSREALLVEWLPKHHVHENLNPDTGLGDDVRNSNPMYHWGALLGFIEMWEDGHF